jgi:phage shock protein A
VDLQTVDFIEFMVKRVSSSADECREIRREMTEIAQQKAAIRKQIGRLAELLSFEGVDVPSDWERAL